ncbi:hypothetical protein [Flavobacterium sp. NLM]|uniref:hypothetical protein n=1 Tax=unclassified Flavobacterium TaxID=196869 RepID=UPI0029370BD9|nr:hypothetical protein [Flavobacterium sp. NLM]
MIENGEIRIAGGSHDIPTAEVTFFLKVLNSDRKKQGQQILSLLKISSTEKKHSY